MNYAHTNRSKRILGITSLGLTRGPGGVMIEYSAADNGFILDSADAPTVAAEILKAAGRESVIVPRSTAAVFVVGNGVLECGDGPERAYGSEAENPNWLRNKAANCIAIAEWIEGESAREAAEKAEAEAAEKKLQERRDALAKEFDTECDASLARYRNCTLTLRRAIDRIIELEDGASRD